VPVQVLVAERRRRREVARELGAGLRQLRCLLGEHFPRDLRVLVQETVVCDRPLAGCARVVRRADGTRAVFVQLALRVGPRRLGADEVLAVLAEQCVALAVEQAGGSGVLVPFVLRPAEPPRPEARSLPGPGVPADHPNGRADGPLWPDADAERRPTKEEIDRWLRS
jgi:hypothetical protein